MFLKLELDLITCIMFYLNIFEITLHLGDTKSLALEKIRKLRQKHTQNTATTAFELEKQNKIRKKQGIEILIGKISKMFSKSLSD